MFALKPPSDAIPVEPRSLKLFRNGATVVYLQVPVIGDQTFTFSVPRGSALISLRTLKITDSRGGKPTASYPAPPPENPSRKYHNPVDPALAQAAAARAADCTGKGANGTVALSKPSGFDADGNATPAEAIVAQDGMLSAWKIDTAKPENGLHIPDADTETLQQLLPHTVTQPTIPVVVSAPGNGHGLLDMSYETMSPHDAAFHLRYAVQPPVHDAGGPLFAWTDVVAKGTVFVFNPLHVPLRGVDVELADLHRYNFDEGMSYTPPKDKDDQPTSRSGGDGGGGGKADSDDGGSSAYSIGSVESLRYLHEMQDTSYTLRNVSLKVGEGTTASIPDVTVDVSSTEAMLESMYESKSCIAIRNKSSVAVPNALWQIPATPGRERAHAQLPRIDSGMQWFFGIGPSGMYMARDVVFGPQTERARTVCDGGLHALCARQRIATFRLHNFQDYEQSATAVLHAQDPEFDDAVEMTLFDAEGRAVDGMVEKLPMYGGHHMVRVRVAAGMKMRFVVTQQIYRHRVYDLERAVDREVVDLLRRGGTEQALLDGLKDVVEAEKRVHSAKLRRRLCKKNLTNAKKGAERAAKVGLDGNVRFDDEDGGGEEAQPEKNGPSAFEQAVERTLKNVAQWLDEVDRSGRELLDAKDAMKKAIDALNAL